MIAPESLAEFFSGVLRPAGAELSDPGELVEWLTLKEYKAKTPLVQAGQPWRRLFYVERGLVRLFYSDKDGREFNKGFFTEGHCMWPVAPRDRYFGVLFHIETIEESHLIEWDVDRMEAYLDTKGYWQAFSLYYAQALLETKFQREHDLLTLSAKEHYQQLCRARPDWVSRIPDYHLASYLGVTSVQLSRLKRGLN